MSESIAVVYRSVATEPIASRMADHEAERLAFQSEVDALKAELDGRDIVGVNLHAGGFTVTGYAMRSFDDLLPGFRKDGSSMRAVPAKRTPEGKEWSQRLSKLRRPNRSLPGFPERMRADGFALYPSVEKVGIDYFLKISMQPHADELKKIDPELWAPAKLSDYHLAKEAKPSREFSREEIDAHLVFLDRAHKMTSSDPATQETHYAKSAKIIREYLAMNGESS